MNIFEAASGIIAVVNDHMVRALRVMSVQRGEDPRDYTLVSFGGAGGLHVCALADALGMQRALVPVNAGVLSALGMLAAEPSRERSRTLRRLLADCDRTELEHALRELEQQARDELREIAGDGNMNASYSVDLRYRGQSYTLNLDWNSSAMLEQEFHRLHESRYGHYMEIPVELVNLRVRVLGQKPPFELPVWVPESTKAGIGEARVYGFVQPVPVYARNSLAVGQIVDAPALVTEPTATTWIDSGWRARVDAWGNLLLQKL
jgi:N-methylhydantoinase A